MRKIVDGKDWEMHSVLEDEPIPYHILGIYDFIKNSSKYAFKYLAPNIQIHFGYELKKGKLMLVWQEDSFSIRKKKNERDLIEVIKK